LIQPGEKKMKTEFIEDKLRRLNAELQKGIDFAWGRPGGVESTPEQRSTLLAEIKAAQEEAQISRKRAARIADGGGR
jgi:hypothetical protein